VHINKEDYAFLALEEKVCLLLLTKEYAWMFTSF
jgi:hypothetical protein